MKTKKCTKCGEVKPLESFHKRKRNRKTGRSANCATCICKYVKNDRHNNKERYREYDRKAKSKERGFLKNRYIHIQRRAKEHPDTRHQCHFTYEEFDNAFQKHKANHGMKSAWGPPHLEMTMISRLREGLGRGCKKRGLTQTRLDSNLSADRLDSSKPYTIQNLIFIRADENSRKKDTTYLDCLIQVRLHKERFMDMKSI